MKKQRRTINIGNVHQGTHSALDCRAQTVGIDRHPSHVSAAVRSLLWLHPETYHDPLQTRGHFGAQSGQTGQRRRQLRQAGAGACLGETRGGWGVRKWGWRSGGTPGAEEIVGRRSRDGRGGWAGGGPWSAQQLYKMFLYGVSCARSYRNTDAAAAFSVCVCVCVCSCGSRYASRCMKLGGAAACYAPSFFFREQIFSHTVQPGGCAWQIPQVSYLP